MVSNPPVPAWSDWVLLPVVVAGEASLAAPARAIASSVRPAGPSVAAGARAQPDQAAFERQPQGVTLELARDIAIRGAHQVQQLDFLAVDGKTGAHRARNGGDGCNADDDNQEGGGEFQRAGKAQQIGEPAFMGIKPRMGGDIINQSLDVPYGGFVRLCQC